MADNTELPSGSGGDVLRTEDRTTFKTPVSLIDVGGTSAEAIIGDSGVAMPCKGTGTAGTANAGVMTVQGIASMTPVQVSQATASNLNATVVGTGTFVTQSVCTNAGTFAVQVSNSPTVALSATDNQVLDDILNQLTISQGSLDDDTYAGAGAWGGFIAAAVRKDTVTSLADTDGKFTPLQTDSFGRLRCILDDKNVINAGTFAVQVSNTATVTGTGGTFPVTDSGGSLTVDAPVGTPVFVRLSDGNSAISTLPVSLASVPSHAVTNAGTFAVQSAQSGSWTFSGTGTAGSAATGVMTVQGIASMTPVQVSQATASNLNATVVGTGTFAVQATCNAGTNLNTSALALESGGNLAGAATSLAVIDDWDESDRCKVNPISGQAGVAGGAGAVGATVQRVVQAGSTPFKNIDVDESQDSVKGSAGTLRAFVAINTTNALLFLKFYNIASGSVTVGTSTPVLTIPIPGNNDTDGAGIVWNTAIYFDTAITIAATTGVADADTGAPGANALIVSGCYD